MALTKEQVEQIKQKLLEQVENTLPEDQKEAARQQVAQMSDTEVEQFLQQNNASADGQQCIFCAIVNDSVKSHKLFEEDAGVATLEINPISLGHTIIIPKEHVSNKGAPPEGIKELTKKVKEIIEKKFSPKDVLIKSSEMFGHGIVNVIPVYDQETMESPRKKASEEELAETQKKFFEKEAEVINEEESQTEEINEENTWLPKRIP